MQKKKDTKEKRCERKKTQNIQKDAKEKRRIKASTSSGSTKDKEL